MYDKGSKKNYDLRWDNLLYIPLKIVHEHAVFEDVVLWQKDSCSLDSIRNFAFNWLYEKFYFFIKKENYKKYKLNRVSKECLIKYNTNYNKYMLNSSEFVFDKKVDFETLNSKFYIFIKFTLTTFIIIRLYLCYI